MGNGRHSGLKTVLKNKNFTIDTAKWQEWQNKTIQDASQEYGSLFSQMSDSDLWSRGLNSNGLQRAILALGLEGPGRIAPDADFDKAVATAALNGVELYRGSSGRSIDNLVNGEVGYIGDGIHGDGIYFSTDLFTANSYSFNKAGARTVTAFIDKGLAKVVTESKILKMLDREPSEVRRQFRDMSGLSAYALYKGYNVIHAPGGNGVTPYSSGGEDYYIPLTRTILVFREHTK